MLFGNKKTNKDEIPNRVIRKLGYKSDQDGIIRRYLNEQGNWNSHLAKTKQFITENCLKFENKHSHIAILGSGWLLDVPLDFLLKHFRKITLCDINHPNEIKHKYRNTPQLVWKTIDISGGYATAVYEALKKGNKKNRYNIGEIKNFIPKNIISALHADVVVSLNLLSQLDVLVVESYLGKNVKKTDIEIVRRMIQQHHVNCLPKNRTILITDIEEILIKKNTESGRVPLMYTEIPTGNTTDKWIWKFDTKKTYYQHCDTHREVIATTI
ncbi:MAG: hypothetical protein MI922_28920 [Bacteroidales bacterium]|nr:hypothetical protein [Bacteroidales bacterium]